MLPPLVKQTNADARSMALRGSLPQLRAHHAAEADVRHAGIRAAPVAGARPVAGTVTVVAQERTALLHPLWCERPRLVQAHFRAGRVVDHRVAGPVAVEVALVPVAAPLPDVTGHIVQPMAVR